MTEEKNFETLLRWLVFPLLLLVFAAQVYAERGLFADGANFFLDILTRRELPWWDHQRIFNHIVTKTPAVIAVLLGIRDITVLRFVFSFWLLLCPLLVWAATLCSLRRDILFWPFVLLFSFVYFSTDFFAVGEFNLCFALLAYCLAALLRPLPQSFAPRAALALAALFLSLNYPATLFSGALLALLAFTKPDKEWNGAPRAYRVTLIVLFALSVASALWEVIAPRDPSNFAGARDMQTLLRDAQFWCALLYGAAIALMFFVKRLWLRFALAVLCGVLLARLVIDPYRFYPFQHYAIRAYMSLALAVCGVGLWLFHRHVRFSFRATQNPPPLGEGLGEGSLWTLCENMQTLRKSSSPTPHLTSPQGGRDFCALPAILAALMLTVLSFFDISLSLDYAQYIDNFRREVNGKTGLVPYEQSALPVLIDNSRFNWGWTNPLMSVVLRDNARKAIILNPAGYSGYQPFDPYKNVPDLGRYYTGN